MKFQYNLSIDGLINFAREVPDPTLIQIRNRIRNDDKTAQTWVLHFSGTFHTLDSWRPLASKCQNYGARRGRLYLISKD